MEKRVRSTSLYYFRQCYIVLEPRLDLSVVCLNARLQPKVVQAEGRLLLTERDDDMRCIM